VLSGTRYGAHRVTVGEDEQSGRVRRHGEHEQALSRNRRLPGAASVVMVTVAGRGGSVGANPIPNRLPPTQFGPYPGDDVIDHAGASCPLEHPMIIVCTAESAEQALAEGQMTCPSRGCGDILQRWGYGRRRRVRSLGADVIDVRPRRVRCRGCEVAQILLPAALQPRRADATEVIGTG
jgi:hypothetical protein